MTITLKEAAQRRVLSLEEAKEVSALIRAECFLIEEDLDSLFLEQEASLRAEDFEEACLRRHALQKPCAKLVGVWAIHRTAETFNLLDEAILSIRALDDFARNLYPGEIVFDNPILARERITQIFCNEGRLSWYVARVNPAPTENKTLDWMRAKMAKMAEMED